MKKILLIVLLFVSAISFSAPPTDWMYLVTKTQFGLVEKNTTYDDMINLFGKDKLKDETHTGPEGEGERKCTIVYKGTELEMTVYWADKKWHKEISSVSCTRAGSPYHTSDSLQIGSNLNAVVKANKAFITFYGFEWDYGGTITNYNKGRLAKSGIIYTLGWKGKSTDTTLLGDSEFNSKMAAVTKRAKQVCVVKMEVSFAE